MCNVWLLVCNVWLWVCTVWLWVLVFACHADQVHVHVHVRSNHIKIRHLELFNKLRSRSLKELTRQISENGPAPPPVESRKSSQSDNCASLLLVFSSLFSSLLLVFLPSPLLSLLPFFSVLASSASNYDKHEWEWREGEDAVSQKKAVDLHNVSNLCASRLQFQARFHMLRNVNVRKSA